MPTVVEIFTRIGFAAQPIYVSLEVSLDLTSLYNNCGLTNAELREMPTKPNLLGLTSPIRG